MFLQWLTLILVVVATEINLVFVVLGGLLIFFIALVSGKGLTDLIYGLSYVLLAFVVWRFLLKTGASENTEISYTMRFATLVMVIAVILLLFGEVMCSAANEYIEIDQVPFLRKLCERDLNVQVTDIQKPGMFDEAIYGFNFQKLPPPRKNFRGYVPPEEKNPKEVPLGENYKEFKEVGVPLCIKKLFIATKRSTSWLDLGGSKRWVIDWNFIFDRTDFFEILESKDSISSFYNKPSAYKNGTIQYLDNLGYRYAIGSEKITNTLQVIEKNGKIKKWFQSFENVPVCFKSYRLDAKFTKLMVDFNTYLFENNLKRTFRFTGFNSEHKQVRESLKELLRSQPNQELYDLEPTNCTLFSCPTKAYGLGNCKDKNASECEMTHVIFTFDRQEWPGDFKRPIYYAVFSLF